MNITTLLNFVLVVVLAACSADYGYKGGSNDPNKTQACNCGQDHPTGDVPPPGPGPGPGPNPPPPCNPPPPHPLCTVRVMVNVKQLFIVRGPGQKVSLPIRSGEVDLCALSHDFFGVLGATLSPQWPLGDAFTSVEFDLVSPTGTNRVETASGQKICSLRVPPGATAGIRFHPVGRAPMPADPRLRVHYDFDENDALFRLGNGLCQLKHPVGHYDLVGGF